MLSRPCRNGWYTIRYNIRTSFDDICLFHIKKQMLYHYISLKAPVREQTICEKIRHISTEKQFYFTCFSSVNPFDLQMKNMIITEYFLLYSTY